MQTDVPKPIVDAWVESDRLVLLSPSFERLTVQLDKLAKYIGTDEQQIAAFQIDEDGRFLHWSHADVHFGWDQLLQLVDPAAALIDQRKSRVFNQRYGAAIRSLREEQGLKQSEVDGLTDRHLRRIERGEQSVSKNALEWLATAHAMPLDLYLKALADRMRDPA